MGYVCGVEKIFARPQTDLLTTAQLARRLGVVRWTICRAVAEGRLVPVVKLPGVNGAYLFDASAVEQWRGARLFEVDGSLIFGAPASAVA